jgi:hypothetical protein
MMRFRWSPEKHAANLRRHGVGFIEAMSVFGDPLSLAIPDPAHSVGEQRWLLLGSGSRGQLLVVAHAEDGDEIRIISVRRATKRERAMYEEGETNFRT